ncbi:MAG: class I SAM-dependent methyltransferase [Candidatus Dojkabacteria bacterium]|nr:MAG: class I SAM-dependent methyltransferase [Candidatus Dojkabacteria bacterium]
MEIRLSEDPINDYYSKNIFYRNVRHLHYPIWEEGITEYKDASLNTSRVVIKALQVKDGDKVLDAGCGVGGTSLMIAEGFDTEVTGITVVPSQLSLAEQYAAGSPAADRVKFLLRDYTDTKFEDGSFDKIFGIESVCYAIDKRDFLKEAYRLLRPKGRVAVLDAYRIKEKLSVKEEKVYKEFLDGFALDNLAFKERFHEDMESVGFKDVKFDSKNEGVKKTLDIYYRYGTIMLPVIYLLEKARLTYGSLGHTVSARNSKFLIEKGVLEYGVFSGEKPR